MAGGRLRSYRLGDRAELLVEQLLSAFAFTTRVPRQEDTGFDFFCSLIRGSDETLLRAGPFFAVQAKSSVDPICYEKDHEIEWITTLENPLLICVTDRSSLSMDVYSTWNIMCGPLARGRRRVVLLPGRTWEEWPGVEHMDDDTQQIYLGKPILHVTDVDIFNDAIVAELAHTLEQWIAFDRTNIVNRHSGAYWVEGPRSYECGKGPFASGTGAVAFYWHRDNLLGCVRNLGRAATAISSIIRDHLSVEDKSAPIWQERGAAVQQVLASFSDLLDPATKTMTTRDAPT